MVEGIDFNEIPVKLAEALNISTFSGQILASLIFMLFVLLPVLYLAKTMKLSFFAVLLTGGVTLGFLTALGWLPYWVILVVSLVVAYAFANTLKGMFTGH